MPDASALLLQLCKPIGVLAFVVSPALVFFCAALLFTRGCCGAVAWRRYAVLKAALFGVVFTWLCAAALKWGPPSFAKEASGAAVKNGSLLLEYTEHLEFAVLAAPFVLAVLLGSYALVTVGCKLFRFNDCEEASAELTGVRWAPRRPVSLPR